MIKSFLLDCIHTFQTSFNERKYWRRRLYLQNLGGGYFHGIAYSTVGG